MWLSTGAILAADAPLKLPPIPDESPIAAPLPSKSPPAAKAQPKESPFHEESAGQATVEDQCDDFCDLPMCGPPGRVWLRADYLVWWTNGMRLPPLVTTSPQGTPPGQAGALPTEILYGDHTVNTDGRSAFRTTVGLWLDSCHLWSAEVDYLNLGERGTGFFRDSPTGNPILARPFFNVQTNQPGSVLVSYANQPGQPNQATGSIAVNVSDYFQSGGVLVSHNLCGDNSCGDCGDSCDEECVTECSAPKTYCRRTDLLMGFRYYNLSDRVAITENTRDLSNGRTNLWTFNIQDSFRTRNDFYGADLGLRTQIYRGRWSLGFRSKVALGNNRSIVGIMGTTTATPPNLPTQTAVRGGVLALASPANIGNYYQRNAFAMIPEMGVELGFQVSCRCRAYLGYNILYWGSVARAADQISPYVDPRNIPSSSAYNPAAALPLPQFPDKTACFWAQGLNAGTEFRF